MTTVGFYKELVFLLWCMLFCFQQFMINLTINDETQKSILEHLQKTEDLLSKVASKLSNKNKKASIYAMPDLGIAQNGTRMMGGFYTGACYTWDTDVPFIPVDATVNVCGTAVYKLNQKISNREFIERLDGVMNNRKTYLDFIDTCLPKEVSSQIDVNDDSKFYWNYNKGNHFVILAESDGKNGLGAGQYMIVHASAIEFKKDNLHSGLYPVKGNWFYDDIQTEYDDEHKRYVRYVAGDKAKRFYAIANYLKDFNKIRNRYFCKCVLGDLMEKEIVNISHYGMPSINSVCIGSQWEQQDYTLLTAPGNDVFLVHPEIKPNNKNSVKLDNQNITLTPHGCGVRMNNSQDKIEYFDGGIKIGDNSYHIGESVNIGVDVSVRTKGMTNYELNQHICKILSVCPGTVYGRLTQEFARTKYGDFNYQEERNVERNLHEACGNSL